MYTDRMSLSINESGTVASSGHLVPRNVFIKFRKFVIDQGHALLTLLSVAAFETITDGEDISVPLKHLDLTPHPYLPPSH